ncbi:WGxxGxxG family protein [Bacillus sp. FJAT-28004]|uniref:WGxxGxxG family protein n=1 Tax=Bacillus sp. FJAT-28004 TaxID=1679165 RepID=UPI0006B4508E|nr:WGxxGxxG family protein [Bacillus sp. FJAT-28004]
MKKIYSLLFAFTILSSALCFPAFAEQSNQVDRMTTDNNRMNSYGTNNTTTNQINGYGDGYGANNTGMNANNYRTNATTDDRRNNWGWLGLLGLTGLIGLRSRDRERT